MRVVREEPGTIPGAKLADEAVPARKEEAARVPLGLSSRTCAENSSENASKMTEIRENNSGTHQRRGYLATSGVPQEHRGKIARAFRAKDATPNAAVPHAVESAYCLGERYAGFVRLDCPIDPDRQSGPARDLGVLPTCAPGSNS